MAEHRVDITAPVDALVQEVPARLGRSVSAREIVATLDAEELRLRRGRIVATIEAARARLEQAQTKAASSQATLERLEKLFETISTQDLAAARLEAEVARAGSAAAAAEVDGLISELAEADAAVERALIRAPFIGTVAARYVDPGSWVSAGQTIATVVSRELLLRLAIPPSELCRLDIGDRVDLFDFESGGALGSARLTRIAPEIDSSSQMVLAEAELESQGALRSQQVVRVTGGGQAPPCGQASNHRSADTAETGTGAPSANDRAQGKT